MPKPSPCPFCGAKKAPTLLAAGDDTPALQCVQCKARGPVAPHPTRAAELWRQRPPRFIDRNTALVITALIIAALIYGLSDLLREGVYTVSARGPYATVRTNRFTGEAWIFRNTDQGGTWEYVEEDRVLKDSEGGKDYWSRRGDPFPKRR